MQRELRRSGQPLPWTGVQAPSGRERVRVLSPQAALCFCSFHTAPVVANGKQRPLRPEAAGPF